MSSLTYLRLKAWASFVRVVLHWKLNGDFARPDEVLQLPSRDSERTLKTNFYRSKAPKPTPVLLNFHGSGFIMPWHGTDDEFSRRVVQSTNYAVLDVAYRLAPEHPFPAAVHDVEDAVKWVLSHPQDFDLSYLAISGFSAGGNLALVASSQLFPKGTFRNVTAFYPPTDLMKDAYSKLAPDRSGNPIPPWVAEIFTECYVPVEVDRENPKVSPIFATAESFQPNTLIITCACDSLCSETENLVRKIQDAEQGRVFHRRMDYCDHAWDKSYKMGTIEEEAKDEAYDLVLDFLRK